MFRYFLTRLHYEKRLIALLCFLCSSAVLIPLFRTISLLNYQEELAVIDLQVKLHTPLCLWTGYTESYIFTGSDPVSVITGIYSELASKIIYPTIFLMAGADFFRQDYDSDFHALVYTRMGRIEYHLLQPICIFLLTFFLELFFLILQYIFCLPCYSYLVSCNTADAEYLFSGAEAAGAIFRLSFYYASLTIFSYMVSTLLIQLKMIIYLISPFLCIGSSELLLKSFHNDPLALAYQNSNLAAPNMAVYIYFMIGLLSLTVIGLLIKIIGLKTNRIPQRIDEILCKTEK